MWGCRGQNMIFLKRDRKKPQKKQRESRTGNNNWGKGKSRFRDTEKSKKGGPLLDRTKHNSQQSREPLVSKGNSYCTLYILCKHLMMEECITVRTVHTSGILKHMPTLQRPSSKQAPQSCKQALIPSSEPDESEEESLKLVKQPFPGTTKPTALPNKASES